MRPPRPVAHRDISTSCVSMKIALFSWKFILALLLLFPITLSAQGPTPGQNVNMVSGTQWPGGDPFLRQQNEPSIAVSTRNPQHLLAGANDYRTVDLNLVDTVAIDELDGDAWLGVFKSFDGGQTWKSTLLPGFPQDLSSFGTSSPMKGFGAASDPVVRAGTNGMFYYSGIAFNRTTNLGGLFLTRFIDLNNKENGDASDPGYPRVPTTDPIRYLGTVEVDQGTATHFIDKPWIAVDIPRANAKTCTFNVPEDNNTTVVQSFPGGNVYIAYSVFTGTAPNMYSKIKFSKSADCGQTWSKPIVISHYRLNQGAEIAVDPETGHIFVSWRVFSVTSDSDSTDDDPDMTKDKIVLTESFDGGNTFVKAFPIRKLMPYSILTPSAHAMFDQNTSATEFRMQTSPTIALDDSGIPGKSGNVYVAWSERGVGPSADARIVLSTSHDGLNFSAPMAVDNSPLTDNDYPADGDSFSRGHQFMPAMTFAGGKLMLTYYDLRLDGTTGVYTPNSPFAPDPVGQFFEEDRLLVGDPAAALFAPYVDDAALTVRRHTLDVVVAQSNGGLQPVFKNARVSRYDFGLPGLGDTNLGTLQLEQLKFNPPNLPMFAQGTVPFIGDYTDVAAQPFVSTPGGVWIYNNPPRAPASSPVFYEVHASNQDVIPPPINPLTGLQDWTTYYPPPLPGQIASIYNGAPLPACVTGYEGDRNQNIYEVPITQGLTVSSPQNSKPLSTTLQRAFAILVQNSTNLQKYFALSIPTQPPGSFRIAGQNTAGGYASFQQALPNQPALPNPLPAPVTTALVAIPPHSGSTRSVFALSSSPIASITVNVNETDVNGNVLAGGLSSFIVLNADGTVPTLVNPDAAPGNTNINGVETYDISIVHPSINNISIVHPSVSAISIVHPGVEAISIVHPNLPNSAVVNQTVPDTAADSTVANSGILANNPVTDATYTITNNGNTSAAYTVKFAGTTPSVPVQLIVNQIYTTQTGANCQLVPVQQGIINVNAGTPQFTDPSQISIVHPAPSDATLLLSPGASAFITLRGQTDPVTMASIVNQVTPVVAPNAVNTNSTATTPPVVAPLFVATATLPNGAAGSAYSSSTMAIGGTPPYTWTTANTDGIALNANGSITGTPSAAGTFNLVATVTDSSVPAQMATRTLTVNVSGDNLTFVQQPTNTIANSGITSPQVKATDNTGAVVSGLLITLSIGPNPYGGTLSGTTSQLTGPNGIANFSEVTINNDGGIYTLVASASNATPATSNPFNVAPQAPTMRGAVLASATSVTVSWNASPTSNVASYNVYRGVYPSCNFLNVGSTGALLFTDTGLATGVTYCYVITALGGGVESGQSFQTTITVPVPGSGFTPTGGAGVGESNTATLLDNGAVLVAGGVVNSTTAWLYTPPPTGTFAVTTGNMTAQRVDHAAALLDNGTVLITGGEGPSFPSSLQSAELYNPGTSTFTATTGLMTVPRQNHTATLLKNGLVLIAGGFNGSTILSTAELYNPATGTFTATGSMSTARAQHTATLLNNGMVLIAGGQGATSSAELYDPVAGTFTPTTGSLNNGRYAHTATLLNGGMVLIAGGTNGTNLASAELFNPATGTFTLTGGMNISHAFHTATLLNNGEVLVAGGQSGGIATSTTELYDPTAGTFAFAGSMGTARFNQAATLLKNGQVLVEGGDGPAAGSAELATPSTFTPPNLTAITVTPDSSLTTVGGTRRFIATGTFSPGSPQQLASVTWSESDLSGMPVAQISNDASNQGAAFGLSTGDSTIQACTGAVCGSTTMTVVILNYGELSATNYTPNSGQPGPRCCVAIAYDPVSMSSLLFGGNQTFDNSTYAVQNDTWQLKGGQWTQLLPTTTGNPPPARSGAAMVYYPAANKVVLFGGSDLSTQDFNDTWVWDGSSSTWTQIFPAVSPSGAALVGRRFDSQGMAYDPNTGTIVMFGGIALNNTTFFNDTWVLSFSPPNSWTWTQMTPTSSPSARRTVLATDPAGNVMLFGGTGSTGNLGDTWVWNGANWYQQSPAVSPSARDLHNVAFDSDIGVVVLFGGTGIINNAAVGFSDTWTWDGGTWTLVTPMQAPPQRFAFGMNYNVTLKAMVVFGGFTTGGGAINDTWELND
jgi:hypothetical protein